MDEWMDVKQKKLFGERIFCLRVNPKPSFEVSIQVPNRFVILSATSN